MAKNTKTSNQIHCKKTIQTVQSSDCQKQVWVFESVDMDGEFRFCVERHDMDCGSVLQKIIDYSQRTWQEIKSETHDKRNKSCHHFLEVDTLSKQAQERVKRLKLDDFTDSIFSMRIGNKLRVIGLRQNEKFIVKKLSS